MSGRFSSRLSVKLRRAPTKYEPVARIASGGMAEVWRANAIFEDGRTHPVAVKRVLPELAAQELMRSMFEDEARLGMRLRHENIVRVYDARDIGGTFIMVMELVDGASLKLLMDRAHGRGACMPLPAALHIGRELARALDYAHTAMDELGQHLGIVHRDVSPHNLLLAKQGAVKLTDFGLADANVHETVRSEQLVGGKLGYLAPEIVRQQATDHRIDIFGVGIVLWEMLAGRRLFVGKSDQETVRNVGLCKVPSLRRHNPRAPAAVDELILRVLSADPDRRPRSARMLLEELDALIDTIDDRVGAKDVALLVGLSLASDPAQKPVPAVKELVSELDEFVRVTEGSQYDIGALPLDPSEFDRRRG